MEKAQMKQPQMTGKERVLAALRGEAGDRLCWSPLIDHYFTSSLPDLGYAELNVPDACRLIGADIIERHTPTICTLEDDYIHRQVQRKGAYELETIETPVGKVSIERGYTKGSVHVMRFPMKRVEDMKIWQYILEHTRYVENYAQFDRHQAYIGNDGIATSSGPFSPITTFLE